MQPNTPSPAVPDLSDAEFAELDELLSQTPEPLEPLDVVMLDGYLCGVLVQPRIVPPSEWLPHVFDFDARPLPGDVDPAWHSRTLALIRRRHDALNRSLIEEGWFDPLVLEIADDAAPLPDDDPAATLGPVSQALYPWVLGLQHATACFTDLLDLDDEAVALALTRLYRHLPVQADEDRQALAVLDQELPLDSVDDALADLVQTVAELHELTADHRLHVPTVRRDTPKVGRNEPCPCGSGRKFKLCHGKA